MLQVTLLLLRIVFSGDSHNPSFLLNTEKLPLPIRVLIPVKYNILRLASLHDWAFYPTLLAGELVLSTPLRVLGVANLLYWYTNLLLFLPVAVLRYLRAHFYCVEAVEVTVRKGSECSVGLLP